MCSLFCWNLCIFPSALVDKTLQDSIKSLDSAKHVEEGGSVTLTCSYSGSVRTLQWYRQYLHAEPQFLQYITTSRLKYPQHVENLSSKLFEKNSSLVLEISPVKMTNSAVYYCALQPTVTGNHTALNKNQTGSQNVTVIGFKQFLRWQTAGQDIASLSSEEILEEGNTIQLKCNYNGTFSSDSLLWYRQYPRSNPDFMYLLNEGNFKQEADPPVPGLFVELNQEQNQVSLQLDSAKLSDSAVYYCALRPTVTGYTHQPVKYSTSRQSWQKI
ncbi:hypothetical protein ACEWY4_007063 [Coilia grayii]|uniref:Ig-like domain-containing protein n=1 Tax=Coilia grayii TaxID=363190 RepID=A0ABD1KF76_9TELE